MRVQRIEDNPKRQIICKIAYEEAGEWQDPPIFMEDIYDSLTDAK